MKIIGLTGGIASGKSFVSRLFAKLGATVLDADRHAHAALSDPEVLQALVARFGQEVLGDDGSLKRDEIAKRVFGDKASSAADREFLEGLVHPWVRERLHAELHTAQVDGVEAAVLDVPLLHEAGWREVCDLVVFVDTPDTTRVSRAAERGWSADELASREAAQLPIYEKRALADRIVPGSDAEAAKAGVEKIWGELVADA